jgi:hypothetical protein
LLALLLASCINQTGTKTNLRDATQAANESNAMLEDVIADSTYQFTGVTVSPDGRLFTNYPYWLDRHSYSVVEVKDGKPVPYPDSAWNSFMRGDNGENKFVCVQAVVADEKGTCGLLTAGIGLDPVYEHSNKVVKINPATNRIERIYRFPESVTSNYSYINDIRIDNTNGFAYMTSSSSGGIVILNINTVTRV